MILRRLAVAAVLLAPLTACTVDEDRPATEPSTTTVEDAETVPTVANDPELEGRLVRAQDLPPGFEPSTDVNDTITAFCAGQDAAAGLQASGRAIVGFTRSPPGASVIELVFRFEADGAARFVAQAEELLTGCSEVPDATGLAFTYEPLNQPVAKALTGATASASRYGVSVGSGDLTVQVAVLQQGDLAALVAVLGLRAPRAELDALATTAFTAARAALNTG